MNVNLQTPSQPATGPAGSALTFDGLALLRGAPGGYSGTAVVTGAGEIYSDVPTAGFTGHSVSSAALNAIAAPRLSIGGGLTQSFQAGVLNLGSGYG